MVAITITNDVTTVSPVGAEILNNPITLRLSSRPGYFPTVNDENIILPCVKEANYVVGNYVYTIDEDGNETNTVSHISGDFAADAGTWLCWAVKSITATMYHNCADVVVMLSPLYDAHGRYEAVELMAMGRITL